jgi:hypothetical protein
MSMDRVQPRAQEIGLSAVPSFLGFIVPSDATEGITTRDSRESQK